MKRIAILLIICAFFLSACTSTEWVHSTVDKQYKYIVTLEQQQKKGIIVQQKYEHPYEIDLTDLEKLMEGLTYVEKDGLMNKKKQSPVFQAVEINRLAPVLADALAKADASQRIRFISFNQGKALLFSVPRKTAGVVFIEPDGRLNIAFNFINSERKPSETTAFYPSYSMTDPLKIRTSDTLISASADYVELHEFETGKRAPMWVVADLEKLTESISTTTVPIIKATDEVPSAVAPKIETSGTTVAETPSTTVIKTVPVQAPEDLLKEDIRNKLRYLKELLDEGLISKTDYNAKKIELLNKIN